MPMKKCTLGKNSYISVPILILTKLLRSAVLPLVKYKSLEGSDKDSLIYSGYNMRKSFKILSILLENTYEKRCARK